MKLAQVMTTMTTLGDFVHFRVYSEHSIKVGLVSPAALAKRCAGAAWRGFAAHEACTGDDNAMTTQ